MKIFNARAKAVYLDLTSNEKSWGHKGWGEPKSVTLRRIMNKRGVYKGGQVILVYDIDRFWPRAYVHHHKLWERPEVFTLEGPNEVRIIMENLGKMIIGEGHMLTGKIRRTPKKKPGLC